MKSFIILWFTILFSGIFTMDENVLNDFNPHRLKMVGLVESSILERTHQDKFSEWNARNYNGITFLQLFDAVAQGNLKEFQNNLSTALFDEKSTQNEKAQKFITIFTRPVYKTSSLRTLLDQSLEVYPPQKQIDFIKTILLSALENGVFATSRLTKDFFLSYNLDYYKKNNFLQRVIRSNKPETLRFILTFMFENAYSPDLMSIIFDDGLIFLEAFRSNNIDALQILLTTPFLHVEEPTCKTENLFSLLTSGQKIPLISALEKSDSNTFSYFLNSAFAHLDDLEQSKIFRQMLNIDFNGERVLQKIARKAPKNVDLLLEKAFLPKKDDKEFLFTQDDEGQTILHLAIRNGSDEKFLYLLKNNFKDRKEILLEWISIQDKNGNTVLFDAAMSFERYVMNNLIVILFQDVKSYEGLLAIQKLFEIQNNDGNSFLHVSISSASLEWFFADYTSNMKDVQNHEISIEKLLCLKNHNGETALHTIVREQPKNEDSLALLAIAFQMEENIWKRKLNKIHFLMIKDKEGKTALEYANASQLQVLIPLFFSNPEFEGNGVNYQPDYQEFLENPFSDSSLHKLYYFKYGKHVSPYKAHKFTNFKNVIVNSTFTDQMKLVSRYMTKVLLRDFLFLVSQENSSTEDYDNWIGIVMSNKILDFEPYFFCFYENFQKNIIPQLESQLLKVALAGYIRNDVCQPFLKKYSQISL